MIIAMDVRVLRAMQIRRILFFTAIFGFLSAPLLAQDEDPRPPEHRPLEALAGTVAEWCAADKDATVPQGKMTLCRSYLYAAWELVDLSRFVFLWRVPGTHPAWCVDSEKVSRLGGLFLAYTEKARAEALPAERSELTAGLIAMEMIVEEFGCPAFTALYKSHMDSPLFVDRFRAALFRNDRPTLLAIASRGCIKAQVYVGLSYAEGERGFPKDRVQAMKWLRIADALGHPIIKAEIDVLRHKIIAAQGASQGSRDLKQAEVLFKAWILEHTPHGKYSTKQRLNMLKKPRAC